MPQQTREGAFDLFRNVGLRRACSLRCFGIYQLITLSLYSTVYDDCRFLCAISASHLDRKCGSRSLSFEDILVACATGRVGGGSGLNDHKLFGGAITRVGAL